MERAPRGREGAACLALTRPLGAFWCEVGQTPTEGRDEAFVALCRALAARQGFEERNKGLGCEPAHARKYMFRYNRITKLKKNSAPPEQIARTKAALKQFRSEALKQKQRTKQGKMAGTQFVGWMLAQENISLEICEGK